MYLCVSDRSDSTKHWSKNLKKLIRLIHNHVSTTLVLSVLTLVASLAWLWLAIKGGYAASVAEPIVAILGIVSAASGLIIDPILEKQRRRDEARDAIFFECMSNMMVLSAITKTTINESMTVFPRLKSVAIGTAFTSGLFTTELEFWQSILNANMNIETLNNILSATETRMLFLDVSNKIAMFQSLSAQVEIVKSQLWELQRQQEKSRYPNAVKTEEGQSKQS